MADEPSTEATQTETTTPVETPPTVKTFTQDEVNRLVGKAREEGRRTATKQQPAEKPAEEETPQRVTKREIAARVESVENETKAELESLKARMAFDKRAAKLGLSEDVQDDLFTLYQAQKPGDLSGWLETKAKLFMKQAPTTQPTPTPAASPEEAPKTPAAAPRAPNAVPATTSGGLVDLFNMTPEQLARFSPADLRREFEKITAIGTQLSGAPQRPKAPQR